MSFNPKQPVENEIKGQGEKKKKKKNLTLTLTLSSTATSQASQHHQQQLTPAKVASTSSLGLQRDLHVRSLVLPPTL